MKQHLKIIHALHSVEHPDTTKIAQATGMSIPSVKRVIGELRRDCGMTIEHVRIKGVHGRVGYFVIRDWGVINQSRFIELYVTANKKWGSS